jgi:hypothetical protein
LQFNIDNPARPFIMALSGAISHKNVTKAVWFILIQLSALQACGRWLLADVHWLFVYRSAGSKKPVAKSLK